MQKWIVKNITDIKLAYDLVYIGRIKNSEKRKFTWRQKKPFIQRRLDYWLISDCLQDFIEETDIIPFILQIVLSLLTGFSILPFLMIVTLKWYYDQKIISFFSSDFESVFA